MSSPELTESADPSTLPGLELEMAAPVDSFKKYALLFLGRVSARSLSAPLMCVAETTKLNFAIIKTTQRIRCISVSSLLESEFTGATPAEL